MTVLGNQVFFEGQDTSGQYGLWKTDGTAAGTSELSIGAPGYNTYLASNGKDVLFDGNYNLWVTDGTSAGTSELSAAGASPTLAPSFMTSVAFPISAATSTLVASPGSVTADGVSTTTLTVTVEDAHGNAVAGSAVTLLGSGTANSFGTVSGTTNANGVFTTTLASTLAQTETITATEGSVHESTSVTFNPGAPSATTSTLVASPGSVTADGVSTTTLTVTVEDAHGNLVPNAAVTLLGSGAGDVFGATSGTTNAQGVFTTTLSSTAAQAADTITATEGSVHETTSVTFNPGAPSATTSTLVASPGSVTADGVSTATLTVTVEDAHGNLVPNAAVTLSGSGTGDVFGATSGTTNAQGVFTTTLSSTTAQAADAITATEGSVHEFDLGDIQSGCSFGDHIDPGSAPRIGDGGRRIYRHADGDGGRRPRQSRSECRSDAVEQRYRRRLRSHHRDHQCTGGVHNHAFIHHSSGGRYHHGDRRQRARVRPR